MRVISRGFAANERVVEWRAPTGGAPDRHGVLPQEREPGSPEWCGVCREARVSSYACLCLPSGTSSSDSDLPALLS